MVLSYKECNYMNCKHKPTNSQIIDLHMPGGKLVDTQPKICRKCGKQIELLHPKRFFGIVLTTFICLHVAALISCLILSYINFLFIPCLIVCYVLVLLGVERYGGNAASWTEVVGNNGPNKFNEFQHQFQPTMKDNLDNILK